MMKSMMQQSIRKVSGLLFMTFVLASCTKNNDVKPKDDKEPPVAETCGVIEVSGTISEPTVWEEGFVYVIKGSNLRITSTLTIKPGVIVKIKDARIEVANGKIIAQGTANKRIVFTSLADDRYCGDTNGDASATKPEKGDWEQIYLAISTGSVFQYVDIFYAGRSSGGHTKAFSIQSATSASFTFDHCRIAHTLYLPGASSYAFYGTSAMKDPSVSKFTNNALYDNGKPICFFGFYTLDPSNIFHNPDDITVTNSHNGIYLTFGSNGSGLSVNWNNTEVPYVYENVSLLQIHPTATINIKPNVIVKFSDPTAGIQSYNENVHLDATAILTSYKDDAHGGDTNGDGNTTTPSTGDWKGFRYTDGGANPGWINGPNILYAEN